MNKLTLIVILGLFTLIAHAEIKVQVDSAQVTMGEPFKLTLSQENSLDGGVPDLTVLQKDFLILGTERSINYSVINGQSQNTSQWVISLQAKKNGILTIPAIKLGGEQTTPVTINVQDASANQNIQMDPADQQSVKLIAGVDESKPYVNQQILYTVKLYNSRRLLDADYQGPQIENALLIPLGETKRYQTVQNNTNYVVEEQNYAIYPQKSGPLKIISPIFTALVYDINPERVKVQDNPIDITVQPIPKQYTGKTWLPAKQVKLTEEYENTKQNFEQGSTLTRTVTVEGMAVPAQLLPQLSFTDTDYFKVYPEKGKENNRVSQGELVGSSEIKVTYLFNKPGKAIIPELKLAWFNTTTGKEEFAVLPPHSLDITPSSTSTSNSPGQQSTPNDVAQTNIASNTTPLKVANTNYWAWVIAMVFASAWLVTLGLWAWQRRSRLMGRGAYKNALSELDKACHSCDPLRARDALLKWASLHWPDAPLLNLTDLTKLVRDAHLKKQLHLLSQVLYRNDAKMLWRGDELLRCVHAIKRGKSAAKSKANNLPPINPL